MKVSAKVLKQLAGGGYTVRRRVAIGRRRGAEGGKRAENGRRRGQGLPSPKA